MSISNREFQSLLAKGILCELAVMEDINGLGNTDTELLGICFDEVIAINAIPDDAPFDLALHAHDYPRDNEWDEWGGECFCCVLPVEVKSAENGGMYTAFGTSQLTFFAEIIQTGTNGYPEYLVHPPEFVVYVDIPTRVHYWYEGEIFAKKVRSLWHRRFLIKSGTAEGIIFNSEDPEFGYVYKFNAFKNWDELIERHGDYILNKVKQKKKTKVYKTCPTLPTLTQRSA